LAAFASFFYSKTPNAFFKPRYRASKIRGAATKQEGAFDARD
jgi:hypothetical protein